MSMFSKVLGKLGLGKKKAEAPKAEPVAAKKPAPKKVDVNATTKKFTAKKPLKTPQAGKRAEATGEKAEAAEAMEMVDVMSKLETMAKGTGLNWKQSIADLLAVLGIENSLDARKELAVELGCPEELIGGNYSKMNIWLHKTVLQKIAENGGNIPQDMLD